MHGRCAAALSRSNMGTRVQFSCRFQIPRPPTTAFAVLKDFWAPVLPQHLTICLGLVAADWRHPTF